MNSGVVEETGKVATSVIDSLKNQPVVLALVLFNVVFMAVVYIGTQAQRDSFERLSSRFIEITQKNAEMLYNCVPHK